MATSRNDRVKNSRVGRKPTKTNKQNIDRGNVTYEKVKFRNLVVRSVLLIPLNLNCWMVHEANLNFAVTVKNLFFIYSLSYMHQMHSTWSFTAIKDVLSFSRPPFQKDETQVENYQPDAIGGICICFKSWGTWNLFLSKLYHGTYPRIWNVRLNVTSIRVQIFINKRNVSTHVHVYIEDNPSLLIF